MSPKCSDCTGIQNNPRHYDGDPVSPERIARCIAYDAFLLGLSVQTIRDVNWPSDMVYVLPEAIFDPREVVKITALIKIRTLYDFLYAATSGDDFHITKQFSQFGFTTPRTVPALVGFNSTTMFTRSSINKFIAHLTNQRITKPKCIPQPKFSQGEAATIQNGLLIAQDAMAFLLTLPSHTSFGGFDAWGDSYLRGLQEVISRLTNPST